MVGSLREVLRRLRKVAALGLEDGLTDAELLRRWSANRDEAAFEVLVWRHGPLVLGLCRHWLLRNHDAEDAFQATFFTLARKAASIQRGQGLAAWLHRVAFRVCLRARQASQPSLQADVVDRRTPGALAELSVRELRIILDEEVNRLPERYRVPFVLCCLAGHTNAEAAQLLCLPVGTIHSRLATARQRLRSRLSRRGLAPAALAGVLALAESAQAGMPAVLVSSTVKAATLFAAGGATAAACSAPVVALSEGVLQAMFTAKLKGVAAVVLSVALLGTSGGVFGYRAFGPAGARAAEDNGPATAATKPTNKEDLLRKQVDALRADLARMRDKLAAQEITIKAQADQLVAQQRTLKELRPDKPVTMGRLPGWLGRQPGADLKGAASKPDNVDVLADHRDSLELLRAQLAVKKALLDAAKVEADQATKRLKRIEQALQAGAVTEQAYRTAKSAAESAAAQLAVRVAELKETEVRVQEAERRLKENPQRNKNPLAGGPVKAEDRLLNLEKKLTELLKEVQAMRRNSPPQLPK